MTLLREFRVAREERMQLTMGSKWAMGDRRPKAILNWRSSLEGWFRQGEGERS